MRRSTRKAIKAAEGRDPNRTKRRIASLTEEDGDTAVDYFQFFLYSTDTERRLQQVPN
jgi:hypothetical protein